ncbi:response regulator [Pedobacter miscanthi]|uniref:response regulator n=1 Tax=Pedobacter miscanthi TaxID=2259170 RepID=UPI003977C0B8
MWLLFPLQNRYHGRFLLPLSLPPAGRRISNLVGTYNDPVNAMRTLGDHGKVDLIFMDIDMPRISGLELAKQVRTMTNKLIFTAY